MTFIEFFMEYFTLVVVFVVGIITFGLWKKCFQGQLINPENLAVFISGCDTGLGNKLAVYLDSLGCDVYAGCLNPVLSRDLLPNTVTIISLDICKESSVKDAVLKVQEILQRNGKDLWALINNAGVCVYGEFEWQTWDQVERQVQVNMLGTMRLTKAFLALLRKNKGRVITITSVNGSISYPGLSVYSATKFALEGLCHAIRLELRRQHGIRVIIVEPGDFARLTSIMSQHEKNAQEMWDNMPKNDQERHGEFFKMYHRVTLKNYGLTSPKNFEQCPLMEDVKDAMLNMNPCCRYVSTDMKYKLFYKVLGWMPFWIVDAFLDKVTDMLFKSDKG